MYPDCHRCAGRNMKKTIQLTLLVITLLASGSALAQTTTCQIDPTGATPMSFTSAAAALATTCVGTDIELVLIGNTGTCPSCIFDPIDVRDREKVRIVSSGTGVVRLQDPLGPTIRLESVRHAFLGPQSTGDPNIEISSLTGDAVVVHRSRLWIRGDLEAPQSTWGTSTQPVDISAPAGDGIFADDGGSVRLDFVKVRDSAIGIHLDSNVLAPSQPVTALYATNLQVVDNVQGIRATSPDVGCPAGPTALRQPKVWLTRQSGHGGHLDYQPNWFVGNTDGIQALGTADVYVEHTIFDRNQLQTGTSLLRIDHQANMELRNILAYENEALSGTYLIELVSCGDFDVSHSSIINSQDFEYQVQYRTCDVEMTFDHSIMFHDGTHGVPSRGFSCSYWNLCAPLFSASFSTSGGSSTVFMPGKASYSQAAGTVCAGGAGIGPCCGPDVELREDPPPHEFPLRGPGAWPDLPFAAARTAPGAAPFGPAVTVSPASSDFWSSRPTDPRFERLPGLFHQTHKGSNLDYYWSTQDAPGMPWYQSSFQLSCWELDPMPWGYISPCQAGAPGCGSVSLTPRTCTSSADCCTDVQDCAGLATGPVGVCESSEEVCDCGFCESCCGVGNCVDLDSDVNNCGACGISCGPGEQCCSATCKDLQSDPLNCGACGTVCGADEVCDSGTCKCPELTCGGACVEFTDPNHCTACGNACRSDQVCTTSGCDCPSGQVECGGVCVTGTACGNCSEPETVACHPLECAVTDYLWNEPCEPGASQPGCADQCAHCGVEVNWTDPVCNWCWRCL